LQRVGRYRHLLGQGDSHRQLRFIDIDRTSDLILVRLVA